MLKPLTWKIWNKLASPSVCLNWTGVCCDYCTSPPWCTVLFVPLSSPTADSQLDRCVMWLLYKPSLMCYTVCPPLKSYSWLSIGQVCAVTTVQALPDVLYCSSPSQVLQLTLNWTGVCCDYCTSPPWCAVLFVPLSSPTADSQLGRCVLWLLYKPSLMCCTVCPPLKSYSWLNWTGGLPQLNWQVLQCVPLNWTGVCCDYCTSPPWCAVLFVPLSSPTADSIGQVCAVTTVQALPDVLYCLSPSQVLQLTLNWTGVCCDYCTSPPWCAVLFVPLSSPTADSQLDRCVLWLLYKPSLMCCTVCPPLKSYSWLSIGQVSAVTTVQALPDVLYCSSPSQVLQMTQLDRWATSTKLARNPLHLRMSTSLRPQGQLRCCCNYGRSKHMCSATATISGN